MKSLDALRRDLAAADADPDFQYEQLLIDVNERILAAMESAGIKRADLADRLGTSRAYVTRLLSGPENITLKTLVRVANALDCRVDLLVMPLAKDVRRSPREGYRNSTNISRSRHARKTPAKKISA